MLRIIAVAIGSVSLIAAGVVHGFWTERFQPAVAPQAAAERLERLPMQLGPLFQNRAEWEGETMPIKLSEAGNGVSGCLQRRYVNVRTKKTVVVYLICGRPGPVSIHSPDVCYAASGYSVEPSHKSKAAASEFWETTALRTRASEEVRTRIYWAWNNGSGWHAADDPRQEYVRSPVLHKLYVLRELDGPDDKTQPDPCEQFMPYLLPALERALFSDSTS